MERYIESVDEDEWSLAFVDSIDDYYREMTDREKAKEPAAFDSNPKSPFIGKTPEECHQLLMKLKADTDSEIFTDYFAIMDERSAEDDTVLLACAARNPGGEHEVLAVETVRATFEASSIALTLYSTGHSSVGEDAERAADEEDNIYRG